MGGGRARPADHVPGGGRARRAARWRGPSAVTDALAARGRNSLIEHGSDTYNPCPGVMDGVPSAKDYEGGFGTSLMIKDIKLALESAGAGAGDGDGPLPMGSRALALYEAMASENAQKDFGGIYKYVYDGKPYGA